MDDNDILTPLDETQAMVRDAYQVFETDVSTWTEHDAKIIDAFTHLERLLETRPRD